MMPAEIRTRRLVLRPPHNDDLKRCAALLGDYEVVKMLSRVPYPYDLDAGRVPSKGSCELAGPGRGRRTAVSY